MTSNKTLKKVIITIKVYLILAIYTKVCLTFFWVKLKIICTKPLFLLFSRIGES